MKILIFKQFEVSLLGHFDAIRTDGEVFAIGGAVRSLLRKSRSVSDYDFTVVGGTYFEKNFHTGGSHRVEVDNTANVNETLADYMSSRDFTINQVAVDREGTLYITEEALRDYSDGVLRPVHPENLSIREGARAIRFSQEYGLAPTSELAAFCREHRKEIKEERVFHRYLREGKISRRKWWAPSSKKGSDHE